MDNVGHAFIDINPKENKKSRQKKGKNGDKRLKTDKKLTNRSINNGNKGNSINLLNNLPKQTSELKRIIKLFNERKNNYTTLQTQNQKYRYECINYNSRKNAT